MAPEQVILAALSSLEAATSPGYAPAQALLNNKAEVAYYHAQILGRTETDFKQLAQVLNGVTSDPASVEAAKAVLTAPPTGARATGRTTAASASPTSTARLHADGRRGHARRRRWERHHRCPRGNAEQRRRD